jgi:hypothetical protein
VFRNGSLTAISVLIGFSLSFLKKWAALPDAWNTFDYVTVGFIAAGIIFHIWALADMLFVRTPELANYMREIGFSSRDWASWPSGLPSQYAAKSWATG